MYERYLRPDELMHYGVIGMKWGVRRYQNPDGSLTEAGARRLGRLNTQQYRNRENYKKAKGTYDSWNNARPNVATRLIPGQRKKFEEKRVKKMTEASRAMSELDLKNERLNRKKQKLTGHTNKSIEGIDLDRSTKSSGATRRSLNYLERQRAKQENRSESAMKKASAAEVKGNSAKAKKWSDRGKAYLRNVKEIDALENTVINKASEKGQHIVGSKHNYITSGKDIVKSLLDPYYNLEPKSYKYKVTRSKTKAEEYERQAIDETSKRKAKLSQMYSKDPVIRARQEAEDARYYDEEKKRIGKGMHWGVTRKKKG